MWVIVVSWLVDRDHVLRSAAALLTRKSTATMDEVARAAGISRATLHRHFAGRDALVRALEALGIAECEAALDARPARRGPRAPTPYAGWSREIEPAAGLLAFLYTENQLFEGEEQNDGLARSGRPDRRPLPARPGARRVPHRPHPRPGSPRPSTA